MNGLLEALLPMVLEVAAVATYETVFVGTSFAISRNGRVATARHVAMAAANYWNETRREPRENIAHAAALFLPEARTLQIYSLDMFDADDSIAPDLAFGQLEPLTGPLGETREMQPLTLSPNAVAVGDWVTMVGFKHEDESVYMQDGAQVFESVGMLVAVSGQVTEVLESGPQIPAPVFRVDRRMFGGMSGGPIFRPGTTEVVGVCARGSVGAEGGDYCYGSMIHPYIEWLTRVHQ